MKNKYNNHDLLSVYIISLNPHTYPMGHIIVATTNTIYGITITTLQMRGPRHRRGKELFRIVSCYWQNRDQNPSRMTPECKLCLNPGVWGWRKSFIYGKQLNTMHDNIVLKCGSNYKCYRNSVWRGTPSAWAGAGLCARHCTGCFHPSHLRRGSTVPVEEKELEVWDWRGRV